MNPYSSMNFVYEPIQFDRLTKLVEFNTLLCIDTIKKELEDIVEKKKKFIPKLTLQDVVNTMRRVSSVRSTKRGENDLKLKVSAESERKLKRMSSQQDPNDTSDSEFVDALEHIPDETTTL